MDNINASCNHCKYSLNNTETVKYTETLLTIIVVIHMYTINA